MSHRALLLLLLLASGLPADAQSKRCKTCKDQRLMECQEHHRVDLTHEHEVLYCSVLDGCPTCRGTGWLACPECDDGTRATELAARIETIERERRALAALDEEMGRPLRKGSTEHFVVVWEMIGMKVDKTRLTEHQMLHLTLQRLERLYQEYVELLGVEASAFAKRSRVFVWHLPSDHERGSLAFCDLYSPAGSKLMGAEPNYSVCAEKRYFITDEQLHRNLVHSVTHLLFSHEQPSEWIGNLGAGWADEGLAHYFEYRFFGLCDNYCYEEVNRQRRFKGGKFKEGLFELVEAGTMPPLASVMQKNSTDLEPEEHPVALGVTDYLIELDPGKFDLLGRKLRGRGVLRDELKDVYGFSILELESRLKAWVLEAYRTR